MFTDLEFGLEKVELEVYSDNDAAVSMYEKAGFEIEGKRLKTRRIETGYQDSTLMGRFLGK